MSQTNQYQGNAYQEKPHQGLKNLSVVCEILGYLSFLGGFVMATAMASEAYDPAIPFILWLSVGFVTGIGYLIAGGVIRLFVAAKENLEELLISTREIASHLRETNEK
ncbi:hypothetical protein [Bellilinea sp.]|uniref:Uncharacterized protein n=1 Tax=Bellilinea caldifistulae TaxID=360411 RepID=A0A7C4L3H8_9CHLR|nr:hypothetical protein [Bellilinea sp.]